MKQEPPRAAGKRPLDKQMATKRANANAKAPKGTTPKATSSKREQKGSVAAPPDLDTLDDELEADVAAVDADASGRKAARKRLVSVAPGSEKVVDVIDDDTDDASVADDDDVDPTFELAQACAALASDKKADEIVMLRVSELTSYADCFVICMAPSERQVLAIAHYIDDELRRAGKKPVGAEGLEQGHWVLVDYGSVVVHIFLSTARHYYDLEGFWADAPRIPVDEARGQSYLTQLKLAVEQARGENA